MSSTHLRISRRGLLAMAGAGLAAATLPTRLFAQGTDAVLIIASGQDIPNFDPHTATGYSASFFMRNVYEPLVRVAGNPPEPVPALAESWQMSDDGLTYTFTLNPAAKFHSGSPVTADDVVYSFQRSLSLAKGNSWMIRNIVTPEGVVAVDPATVEFKLAKPYAAFLQVLPWIFVVEKAQVEANLGADQGQTWLMTNTAGAGRSARPGMFLRTSAQLSVAGSVLNAGGSDAAVVQGPFRSPATSQLSSLRRK